MSRNNIAVVTILLLIFAFAICALIYPLFGRNSMRLGLDLVGGSHLVYQAQFPEDATAEEKLRAMQSPLEQLATVTRAHLEGTTVEQVKENENIAQLKSEIVETKSEIAQLRQDLQIALQALQDKSNVQETQVPEVRSLQPQQVTKPVFPAQTQKPMDLHSIIQRSVQ